MKEKQFNGSIGPKSGCTLYVSIGEGEEKPLVEGNAWFGHIACVCTVSL
jgi:hypothetical protein